LNSLSEVLGWADEEEKWFVYLKRSYLLFISAPNVENRQSMFTYFLVANMLECSVEAAA
jgi:hypothetical protein